MSELPGVFLSRPECYWSCHKDVMSVFLSVYIIVCVCVRACLCACVRVCVCRGVSVRVHKCAFFSTLLLRARARTHTHTHTHTHTSARTHARTHSHTHTHTRARARTHTTTTTTTNNNNKQNNWKLETTAVPLVDLMYFIFTRTPGESYRWRFRSLLVCLCDVFRALCVGNNDAKLHFIRHADSPTMV